MPLSVSEAIVRGRNTGRAQTACPCEVWSAAFVCEDGEI